MAAKIGKGFCRTRDAGERGDYEGTKEQEFLGVPGLRRNRFGRGWPGVDRKVIVYLLSHLTLIDRQVPDAWLYK